MFESFIQFIISQQVKTFHKIGTFLFILVILFLVNNIIGFTYYYNNQEKLTQLEQISRLKNNPNLSEESKSSINQIETDLNKRQNVLELATTFISSIKLTEAQPKPKEDTVTNNEDKDAPTRNNLLLFFTSSWYLIYICIYISVMILVKSKKEIIAKLKLIILFIITLSVGSLLSYYLMTLIPRFGDNWTYNYILSAVYIPIIISIPYLISKFKEKRNINV